MSVKFEMYPDRTCLCIPWDGELKSLPKPCKITFVVFGAFVAIGGLAASGCLIPHMGFFAYFPGIGGLVLSVPLLTCGLKGLDHEKIELEEVHLKKAPSRRNSSRKEIRKKSSPSRSPSEKQILGAIKKYFSEDGFDITETLKRATEVRFEKIKALQHTKSVKVFKSQQTHRVYTIDNYPELIFKFSLEDNKETKMRYGFVSWGRQVCKDGNLDGLKIPQTGKFTVSVNGSECIIIVEEKLPIGDYKEEKQNYEKYSTEQLKKPIQHLTQFICETGFYDLEWRNIPLIETESGEVQIALIDLEVLIKSEQAIDWGLFGALDNPSELRGLIRCLQPDQAEIVIEEAKKHIEWTPEREEKAQKAIALRRKEIDEAAGL